MPEIPGSLTLDQLQNNLWGFLFDPNVGLLRNVRDSVSNSQNAVVSGIAYHNNNLSNQVTSNTNAVQNHISNSTAQLQSQVAYVLNAISSQLSSNVASLASNINQTESDIQSNVDSEAIATRQLSQNLANGINANVDNEVNLLDQSLQNAINLSQNGILGEIANLASDITGIEFSIQEALNQVVLDLGNTLANLFDPFITFLQGIIKLFQLWFDNNVTDKLEQFFTDTDVLRDLHFDIFKGKFPNNPDVLTDLGIVGSRGGITSKLLLTILSIPTLVSLLGDVTKPAWRDFVYKQESEFRSLSLDPNVLIASYYRDNMPLQELYYNMQRLGYNNQNTDFYIDAIRRIPDITSLRDAFLRGIISEDDLNLKLKSYGFSLDDISTIKKLFATIPPLSDIITMAVREVFSPEIVREFGQKEGYPDILTSWAAKQGLSKEWAENYWAAHWDLPSTNQGFEMLHRSVITSQQLDLLLRAKDIMPFWREKLKAISYNPLTRVDVRRMYRVGVLSRAQVKEQYKQIGYTDIDAERLTEFTIRYETPESEDESSRIRQLTQSAILKSYEKGTITRIEAKERLLDLRYLDIDAEMLLELKDFEINDNLFPDRSKEFNDRMGNVILASYRRGTVSYNEALDTLKNVGYRESDAVIALTFSDLEYQASIRASIVDAIKQAYVERTITNVEATNILNSYRFSSNEIRRILDELNIVRDLRVRKPTQAQFEKAFENQIITESQYKEELRGLGYAEKYLDLLVKIAG